MVRLRPNQDSSPLLVYGGTFDPVHQGHVGVAKAAADALGAEELLLQPCGDPPHRERPQASGAARAQMLRIAFADDSRFFVDERELRRQGPSYTLDTLRELRAEQGTLRSIVLLLGADAAAGLQTWHRPTELPLLAHLLVFARPGTPLPDAAQAVGFRPADSIDQLRQHACGLVFEIEIAVSAHSSTAIRAALAAGESRPSGLPAPVADWLSDHAIYQ